MERVFYKEVPLYTQDSQRYSIKNSLLLVLGLQEVESVVELSVEEGLKLKVGEIIVVDENTE